MSTLLGPIRQLGYVVDDIEAGMKHWSEVMGVGPWFYNPQVPIEDYLYDGQSHQPHIFALQEVDSRRRTSSTPEAFGSLALASTKRNTVPH